MANFDLATRQMRLAGRGGNSKSLVEPDRNNLAPRVGVAYRAAAHTVVRAGWGVFYSAENDAREDVLTKNSPFAVEQTIFNDIFGGLPFAYRLDAGVARITAVPPLSAGNLSPAAIQKAAGSQQNVFAVDPRLLTGYSQLFNLAIQREMAGGLTIEAAYVGSTSRKLPYAVGNVNAGGQVTSSLGQIQALFAEGSASFHSGQVKASKRLTRHLSFLAVYTYGKNIDNGPAPFNLGHNQNAHNQPQDPLRLSAERALADDDV